MSSVSRDNWPEARDRLLATIPNPVDGDTVRRYLSERQARGVKPSTLSSEGNALRSLCQSLKGKTLDEATRQDLVAFANEAKRIRTWRSVQKDGNATVTKREARLGQSTLAVRLVIVKSFYRWLRGTDEYPSEVKGLVAKRRHHDSLPTDELVTKADLQALLQMHHEARDRAIIAVLYDAGLRASELCALNIGSVGFDEYGAVLTLPKDGENLKTGARRVRIHEAVPYLHAWYEAHPFKHEPRAALFHTRSHRAPFVRMTSSALWTFVNQARLRAGITKRLHPHLFRHSAATERARLGWTEGMMRAFFGWSRRSDMPSVYVHLAGGDYERMDLERRGLLKDGDVAKPALTGLTCSACQTPNIMTALFCKACRNPLTPEAEAAIVKQRMDQMDQQLRRIIGDLTIEPKRIMVATRAVEAGTKPLSWRGMALDS